MKTSEVAKLLGVNPRTITKWIHQFELNCEKNELGHFDFSEEDVESLREVQKTMQQGSRRQGVVTKVVDEEMTGLLQQQLDELLTRVIENERRTEEKAGEIVTFQILEHRKELDALHKHIQKLEGTIEELETKLKDQHSVRETRKAAPKWRTFLTGLFSF
ncbi:MerR family transcriptional regulator [Priestia koreensis]|uniref:Chromosome-anchoring protein RacA n=1 Tax=Priestia koreensis TaxID=284581 RepID=A0A0M0LHU5_9BACI|nr:MerR family transcriptional regulator [Priestia koreensis]KOO50457.1 hypothetical protein AMD01_01500 [Priestia koreensis]MCM3003008.1 MerR family transcriptional regulator [Priestia koreensis]